MNETELAIKIMKEYGRLRKEDKVNGRLFEENSVTLATRVRLDILTAIARKCSNATEDMLVMGLN